jgi:hypothetical protein
MFRRDHRAKMQVVARDDADAGAGDRVVGQRQIGLAGQHRVGHLVERQHPQPDMHARMRVEDGAEKARQRACREPVHGRNRHLAARQTLQSLDVRFDPLMAFQRLANVGDEHFAGRREPQPPRHPLENRGAQVVFQSQDLPVDRRRGNIEPARRLSDRPQPGNLVEVFQ